MPVCGLFVDVPLYVCGCVCSCTSVGVGQCVCVCVCVCVIFSAILLISAHACRAVERAGERERARVRDIDSE